MKSLVTAMSTAAGSCWSRTSAHRIEFLEPRERGVEICLARKFAAANQVPFDPVDSGAADLVSSQEVDCHCVGESFDGKA